MTRCYVEITRLAPFLEVIFGELVAEDGKVFRVDTGTITKVVETNLYHTVRYVKTIVSKA